jgi:predicted MPP superfamily phosphohydrolase
VNLNRRTFLKRLVWSSTALGAAAIYPALIEPHRIQINHITLPVPQLPRALDGLTIAHLTDLHRSRYVSADYLTEAIELTNALHPDIIAFTGDYITHGRTSRGRIIYGNLQEANVNAASCADIMAKAKASHGVFACLGNHDHWFNAHAITSHLQQCGITVLRNISATVTIRGTELPVIGLGDLWTEGVNIQHAFAGVTPPFSLVLMHNPDYFEQWQRPGSHLILAGHTHGGQVKLPILGAPIVPSSHGDKYAHGLFRAGDTHMYVNRGLGLIFPAVRFNCRPEITFLHLHAASVLDRAVR